MSQVDRWTEAANLFDDRVGTIAVTQWTAPTPCSEWTVEDLVNHVAGTHVFVGSLIGLPKTPAKWREVHAAMASLLRDDDALLGTAEVPGLGEMSKSAILDICINDMLIHTWDLSRAIGAEEALPADAVDACYEWLCALPEAVIRAPNRYGDAAAVATDADVQTRMLAYAGRVP